MVFVTQKKCMSDHTNTSKTGHNPPTKPLKWKLNDTSANEQTFQTGNLNITTPSNHCTAYIKKKERKSLFWRHVCIPMFIAALFIIAEI